MAFSGLGNLRTGRALRVVDPHVGGHRRCAHHARPHLHVQAGTPGPPRGQVVSARLEHADPRRIALLRQDARSRADPLRDHLGYPGRRFAGGHLAVPGAGRSHQRHARRPVHAELAAERQRAASRGGAQSRRGRHPRQGRLSGHGLARAAHAAQRHHQHSAGLARRRAAARSGHLFAVRVGVRAGPPRSASMAPRPAPNAIVQVA